MRHPRGHLPEEVHLLGLAEPGLELHALRHVERHAANDGGPFGVGLDGRDHVDVDEPVLVVEGADLERLGLTAVGERAPRRGGALAIGREEPVADRVQVELADVRGTEDPPERAGEGARPEVVSEPADPRGPRHLLEHLLPGVQLGSGRALVRQVVDRADRADEHARLVEEERGVHAHVAHRPVVPEHAIVDPLGHPARHAGLARPRDALAVVRVDPREEASRRRHVDLGVVAEDAEELLRPAHLVGDHVPDPGADVRDPLRLEPQRGALFRGVAEDGLLGRLVPHAPELALELRHAQA